MRIGLLITMLGGVILLAGCASPNPGTKALSLGMTPGDVVEAMGNRYAVRASKELEDGRTTQVWEFVPPPFSFNPKTYWVIFEDDRVVQWGQPGDFGNTAGANVPVREYRPEKSLR